MWGELAFAISSSVYVLRSGEHSSMRYVAGGTLLLYLAGIGFALVMWAPALLLSWRKSRDLGRHVSLTLRIWGFLFA